MKTETRNLLALTAFFALVAAAALFGAQFKPGDWYAVLARPEWTPPNAVFAPVWTILYIAIAIAGWLEWRSDVLRSPSMALWFAQLLLNAAWSWLFFGLHRMSLALAEIALLLVAIVAFIVTARSRAARLLFVPYALWVAFAAALNLALLRLN